MREIDIGVQPGNVLPVNSILTYGGPKVGKTTWAGTSPRPLFLSDMTEHGFESLREENWDNEATPLFEAGVRPIVWGIETEQDISLMVEKARPLAEAGVIKTVWVDSISFLADLVFNSILMSQAKRDTRAAYGELGVRLRNIRIKIASLGCSVGWLAHEKQPSEDDPVGRPLIPGAQAEKFAGSVDFLWRARFEQSMPSKPGQYLIHTRKYAGYVAGHRLGGRAAMLPEPMVNSTYATFLQTIGYDVDLIRSALPPIEKARADAKSRAAKAVAQAQPPIAAAAQPSTAQGPSKMVIRTNPQNGKTVASTSK